MAPVKIYLADHLEDVLQGCAGYNLACLAISPLANCAQDSVEDLKCPPKECPLVCDSLNAEYFRLWGLVQLFPFNHSNPEHLHGGVMTDGTRIFPSISHRCQVDRLDQTGVLVLLAGPSSTEPKVQVYQN